MFKKIVTLMTAFAVTLTTLLFSSCSSNSTNNVEGPKNDDELIMAIGGEPEEGFDPTTGWGRYGSPLFQSTILKRSTDMSIINDLATNYTISDDGLIWTVNLRDDVKFSDGAPLTATDVVFTYETISESNSVVDLNIMDKVKALDDYTVKFTLKNPQSTFVNILVNTGIVPKHAYNSDYYKNPLGSGPFKLVQWDKGQQLIVEANTEYYGEKPYFKKITFLYLSEEAAFAAAQAGTVDVVSIAPSYVNNKIAGMGLESVQSIDNRGIMFPFVKPGDKTKDGYPIGNEVTSDLAIRQAINLAVDRKSLVDGILNGYGSPAYTVCDNMPWWNANTVISDADIDGAKKLLSDGGWIDSNGDGTLEKGTIKAEFSLIYPSSDQIRQSLAIAVADQVKPLGIKINVEGKSWDDIETLMYSNAVVMGWGSHDPLEMYNLYNSKYTGVDWYNTGFYSNATVDEYLNKALSSTDENEAIDYWKKAQWDGETGFSANGDAPWAWLVNLNHLYLVRDNLSIGNQKIHPHGHGWPITDNIEEWHWNN